MKNIGLLCYFRGLGFAAEITGYFFHIGLI